MYLEVELRKLCQTELPFLHEKLYSLMNEIEVEMRYLEKKSPVTDKYKQVKCFIDSFKTVLRGIIKNDSTFTIPYIRRIIEMKSKHHEEEAYAHLENLKKPVADLIFKQNQVMLSLQQLKQDTGNFNMFFVRDSLFRRLMMHLFELYQTFERYVFIEENLVLSDLVRLFENKGCRVEQEV